MDNNIKLKKMYNKNIRVSAGLNINQSYQGETIEQKIERVVNNKEPITDGATKVYTERKDGVRPEYDIRTDRFEVAVEAMDKVAKSNIATRQKKMEIVKGDEKKPTNEGGETPANSDTSN